MVKEQEAKFIREAKEHELNLKSMKAKAALDK